MAKYIRQYKLLISIGSVLQFFGQFSDLFNPYFLGLIIDALGAGKIDEIYPLLGYFAIIIMISSACDLSKNIIFTKLSEKISKTLKTDLYRDIIRKDLEFFDDHKTGDLRKFPTNPLKTIFV